MGKWSRLLAISLVVALLTGCGQNTLETGQSSNDARNDNNQADISWNTVTLKYQDEFSDEAGMYLTGYEENWLQEPDRDYTGCSTYYAADYGDICVLKSYSNGQDENFERWITAYYYDCDTKQTKTVDISYDLWEMSTDYNVMYLDIISPGKIAFAFNKLKEGANGGTFVTEEFKVVFYDMETGADGMVDILPALTQKNVDLSSEGIFGASLAVDMNGNIYLTCGSEVVVMDPKGKLITTMEIPEMNNIAYIGKTVSGLPLFYARTSSGGTESFFCYDSETKKIHNLGEIPGYFYMHMATNGNGTIYCIESGDVIAWNCVTGEKRKLINCKDNGINGSTFQLYLTYLSDGSIAIWDSATEESAIYYLTNEKLVEDCVITINSLAYGWDLAESTAAIFSRKTPGVTVEYLDNYDEQYYKDGTYAVKMMAELMEGKGADMMVIPYEDFLPLYEKGVLADLSDVFDEETKTQVISQVWKPGTVDGKLFGIQDSYLYTLSMIAPKKYMTKDGWTLDDIYRLMEEGNGTLEGISPMSDTRENLLYFLLLLNLPTRFVDYENSTCNFDNDEFRKLLELCKNNKVTSDSNALYGGPDNAQKLKDGNYLATLQYITGLASYGIQMNYYGPDYCYIGLPSDNGIGNVYLPSTLLVVNKNTEHMDLIKDYLNMLYSKPIQRKDYYCVRKDVYREYIVKSNWDDKYVIDMGNNNFTELEMKSDGSTYVEDYFDFMDNTVPIAAWEYTIFKIIFEEVKEYFNGNADLDKTVKTIQNRVQLMLNEK